MSEARVSRSGAEDHRRAVECGRWYDVQLPVVRGFAVALERVLNTVIDQLDTKTLPVQVRVKSRESFLEKCVRPARTDPTSYRYIDPVSSISDLVGARITLYLLGDAPSVSSALGQHLVAEEQPVHGMGDGKVPGYQGQHFSVAFTEARLGLPEYRQFSGLRAELQLRTVLQHAWAEIQHDLIYKPQVTIPVHVQRRLVGLAGILDVADREFEAVTQAFDDVAQRAAGVVQVDVSKDDASAAAALDRAITLPDVPSADAEWITAFLEVLDSLALSPLDLPDLVGRDSRAQRAAVRVLRAESGSPNKVQLANALLSWRLGDEYVRRHPLAASSSEADLQRLMARNRERVQAMESALREVGESSTS